MVDTISIGHGYALILARSALGRNMCVTHSNRSSTYVFQFRLRHTNRAGRKSSWSACDAVVEYFHRTRIFWQGTMHSVRAMKYSVFGPACLLYRVQHIIAVRESRAPNSYWHRDKHALLMVTKVEPLAFHVNFFNEKLCLVGCINFLNVLSKYAQYLTSFTSTMKTDWTCLKSALKYCVFILQ